MEKSDISTEYSRNMDKLFIPTSFDCYIRSLFFYQEKFFAIILLWFFFNDLQIHLNFYHKNIH